MKSKFFTFYSYKGGSGRSTTLVNTAKHLADILKADPKHPILLVDADLESAGLTYFFHCEKKFTDRIGKQGLLHAEKFLNAPDALFKDDWVRKNTFARSEDWEYTAENWDLIHRLQPLLEGYDVAAMLDGVILRDTIGQVLLEVTEAEERYQQAVKGNASPEKADAFIHKTYNLKTLFKRLFGKTDLAEKRAIIENFLPTDGVVDVSCYFGKEEGTVKFIGVDVAYEGEHASMRNETARRNKSIISRYCGNEGYSAILFDCGAGVQSTAHILNQISDVMVYCMRPTLQFVSGTLTQLENYQDYLLKTKETKSAELKLYLLKTIEAKSAELNLENEQDYLLKTIEARSAELKSVILLPTAVPTVSDQTAELEKDSFWRIGDIANNNNKFVDDTFCTYEASLHEVAVFKWREIVLGTDVVDVGKLPDEAKRTLSNYSSYEKMPEDAKGAYNTYKRLAERLVYHAPITDIEE